MHQSLTISTSGRGLFEITDDIQQHIAARADGGDGLCHLFIHHTSASLLITENADPDVLTDLESYFARLVQDGDPLFVHTAEGPDDMSAHVRCALTQTQLTIPVVQGRCDLGTWQGVFVWEHRARAHQRRVTVSFSSG